MKKIIIFLLATLLLLHCGINTPQAPKDEAASQMFKEGVISFYCINDYSKYPHDSHKRYNINLIEFNNEAVAKVKLGRIFAYSVENGLLTISINVSEFKGKLITGCDSYEIQESQPAYTIMYVIDLKNKAIIKEERLNALDIYKDSDLEFSVIRDGSKISTIQYTRKNQTSKIALPETKNYNYIKIIYISKEGYIVFITVDNDLNVFSMDSKKFTYLGKSAKRESVDYPVGGGWHIPFSEYIIYFPLHTLTVCPYAICSDVYLYNYAKETTYVTRYQKADINIAETIELNIKNGNIYEQFTPLAILNTDSISGIINTDIMTGEEAELYIGAPLLGKEASAQDEHTWKERILPYINIIIDKYTKSCCLIPEQETYKDLELED